MDSEFKVNYQNFPSSTREKLLSAFYNFKFSFTNSLSLDNDESIIVLGHRFEVSDGFEDEAKHEISKQLYFSYRHSVPNYGTTHLRSDAGWGCMYRSTQMMIACALRAIMNVDQYPDPHVPVAERNIVRLFDDDPFAPLSLHRVIFQQRDQRSTLQPGEWIGPATASFLYRKALEAERETIEKSVCGKYRAYHATDCLVKKDEVLQLVEEVMVPILLLIPTRLGTDRIVTEVQDDIRRALSLPCSVGIAGGKPRHSIYFVGFQGETFIGLDPHKCAARTNMTGDFDLSEFHLGNARTVHISDMDPCMCFGFLCRTVDDLEQVFQLGVKQSPGQRLFSVV